METAIYDKTVASKCDTS